MYLQHEWIAPGMKWIDPLKEANANKVALETNQTTLAEIIGNTGNDWRDVIDQRARELEYMQEKGVIRDEKSVNEDEVNKLIQESEEEKSDDES